jgi:glucuronate isomerase
MTKLSEGLYDEILKIPAIDVHSHVRPLQPSAASLRELLSYHYYTELAYSSGMPKSEMADSLPDNELLANLIAAMADFDNTVQYEWLVEMAHQLFGFRGRRLTVENWRSLAAAAGRKLNSPNWTAEVLSRANVEKVFLTNSFFEELEGFDREVFVPCLRCDDLVFNLGRPATQEALAKRAGGTVTDAQSLRHALDAVFDYFLKHDAKSAALSLPPDFVCRPVSDAAAAPLLTAALQGDELPHDGQATLRSYVLYLLAERCRATRLPMQLMIGVVRNVYQHGVPLGTDLVSNQGSLAQYADLFNRFHDVTFCVSCLSPALAHELLAYTWIFQNVRASGHWWYAGIPGLIEPLLRCRIEALPRTKLLGYYSDAYYVEFILPKFNMYRRSLSRILSEQVEMRRLTEDDALELAARLLRENAVEIFSL